MEKFLCERQIKRGGATSSTEIVVCVSLLGKHNLAFLGVVPRPSSAKKVLGPRHKEDVLTGCLAIECYSMLEKCLRGAADFQACVTSPVWVHKTRRHRMSPLAFADDCESSKLDCTGVQDIYKAMRRGASYSGTPIQLLPTAVVQTLLPVVRVS